MLMTELSRIGAVKHWPEHDDRVEYHCRNWARFMFAGKSRGLGLPGRAHGGIGISHSADFDQLCDITENWAARAVDAIISHDLKPLEHKALKCAYLGEEWTSVLDMGLVLVTAKEQLMRCLNRKGIV